MLRALREPLVEALWSILPVICVVAVLFVVVPGLAPATLLNLLMGALLSTVGLALFLLGVRLGLLPIGEHVGSQLPQLGSPILILLITFILGVGVTIAEPDIRVLAHQAEAVSGGILSVNGVVVASALGIGAALSLALLRVFTGLSISRFLTLGLLAVLVCVLISPSAVIPLAFDAAGATTGAVTVPFILALGVGATSVLGGKSALADGFGLVGLSSLGPIVAVLLLGIIRLR